MGIGSAPGVNLLDVFGIHGELHPEPVRTRHVQRQAISVSGHPARHVSRRHAAIDLVEGLPVDLEREMPETTEGTVDRLGCLVYRVVGELEKRERAAVGQPEERMAIRDVALKLGIEGAFAPGGDQGHPEDVFEEVSIGLLVANDEGGVMQPQRQLRKHCLGGATFRMVHHRLLSAAVVWREETMFPKGRQASFRAPSLTTARSVLYPGAVTREDQ